MIITRVGSRVVDTRHPNSDHGRDVGTLVTADKRPLVGI
jgi:hypothetical protein